MTNLSAWFTAKLAGKLPEFVRISSGETLAGQAAVRKYVAVQLARSKAQGKTGKLAAEKLEHLKQIIEKEL